MGQNIDPITIIIAITKLLVLMHDYYGLPPMGIFMMERRGFEIIETSLT